MTSAASSTRCPTTTERRATDDPGEWEEVGDGLWQSHRKPFAFSRDGGATYTLTGERDTVHVSEKSAARS